MKILFCYDSNRGGGNIAMQEIASAFQKIPNVIALSKTCLPITKWNLLSYINYLFKTILFWLSFIIKQKNIDWIYTSTYTSAVAASIVKPFLKFNICFHYHVSEVPTNKYKPFSKRYFTQIIKISLIRACYSLLLTFTDLIIVPSVFSKKSFVKAFGIPGSKPVKVIYNGASAKFFLPTSKTKIESLRKELDIKKSDVIISYFGRLHRQKNIHLLLNAMTMLDGRPKLRLNIVFLKPNNLDERNYKNELTSLTKILKLKQKVTFVESPSKLNYYYEISDLVMLPSFTENLPLVMLESFAARKLFIASAVGGIPEVLSHIDKRLLIKDLSAEEIARKVNYFRYLKINDKKEIIRKEYEFVKNQSWAIVSQNIHASLQKARS